MRAARVRAAVLVLAGLALSARAATAQTVAANRATAYLMPTDATDARALWVNPAGLAVRHEASVMLDLTVRQPGDRGQLGQITAGFNARGLSFGYQRDNLEDGTLGHTYRLGLGGVAGGLAAGVALAFYRGGTSARGWDIGARYEWRPSITLGGVIEHIGQPVVRGVRQEATYVPAVTLRPFGALVAVSAQAAFTASAAQGYGVQARVEPPGPLGFVARLDTDRSLHRTALAFGLSLGRRDEVGVVGSTGGDPSQFDAASLYGVSRRTASH